MLSFFGMTDAFYEIRKTKYRWEMVVMKLVTLYIFLLFAPGFAIAKNISEKRKRRSKSERTSSRPSAVSRP